MTDAFNQPAAPAILSIDVEEYFQAEASLRAGIRREDWDRIPLRAGPRVARILELLDAHASKATFFILGWNARRIGDVVRQIAAAGHEVASHGMDHRMLGPLGPAAFRQDLLDSRSLLEDLSGRPVRGYRAPTFSITHQTAWALDALCECGFQYDSSIFPIRHDRYGVPEAPRGEHLALAPGGGQIVELPPLTLRLAGMNLPVGGGGYLRLLPVRMVGYALRRAQRARRVSMIYLHPWELDPDQPVLPMGRLSRWRHRVNLHKTEGKLTWLLRHFRFRCAAEVVSSLDASTLQTFRYGARDGI